MINPCLACYGCRKTKMCIQKDDMQDLLEKMINADVIVLATPVYFYSMSGQMKVMIDRTLPHYTEIRDKEFYFIVTAADGKEMMERTMDSLRGFTDCLPNSDVKSYLYGAELYGKGEAQDSHLRQVASDMGKNI